jgi:dGTPase
MNGALQTSLEKLFVAMREGYTERYMSAKIGKYISACSVSEIKNQMSEQTNRYRYKLLIDDAAKNESKLFKKLSLDLVFLSPQLNQVEKKGDFMLKRIFDAFTEQYLGNEPSDMHLLPASFEQRLTTSTTLEFRARLICDYIAGMTDGFAIRTYKRLFDPDFGSLADLI